MVLNHLLAKDLCGDSVASALFSFTACAVRIGVYSLIWGVINSLLIAISTQPWWSLLGGVSAHCFVTSFLL